MDQYLVYGEEYKAVRDAVAKAVVDGDVEQIEEVCEVFKLNLLTVATTNVPYILFCIFRSFL